MALSQTWRAASLRLGRASAPLSRAHRRRTFSALRRCVFFTASLLLLAPAARAADPAGFTPPANLTELQNQFRRPADIPFPADNPYTPEAALLGRTLFFDARLSGSGSLACASCHNPSFGWEDGLRLGHGEGLRELGRHTPSILNAAWGKIFFWDGRAPTLEAQASGPMGNPNEMNQDLAKLPAKLGAIAGYGPLFERAFPKEGISIETVTKAIAVFERTVASSPAPFDAWLDGDQAAISDAAKRGFVLFTGTARCASCHSGWTFTDDKFYDIGLTSEDRGRAVIDPAGANVEHAFKTPTLRNVARRAPYMHDGSLPDLPAVMEHYVSGGLDRPSRSTLIEPLHLSPPEIKDLLAFLASLSEPARSFPTPTLPQ
jgi:cytochrome c peroxidase